MSYNIIIWVECRHLDHKTYDDLPLREKISLSFVRPRHLSGYQWPGSYSWNCIYIIFFYRLHSTVWIGIAKQSTAVTLILEVLISLDRFSLLFLLTSLMVLVRRMYVNIK